MKKVNIIFLILIFAIISGCKTTGERIFPGSHGKFLYTDNDWNLDFYDNWGMPKSSSVKWIKGTKNNFIRFQLENKDYGKCSTDKKPRHGAPYWERAELKQKTILSRNKKYELSFNVRFVEGFLMNRETFFQMHSYKSPCNAGPPLMLKISNEKLIIATRRRNSSTHLTYFTKISLLDLIGKWNTFRIIFDLSQKPTLSLNLNGKQIISNRTFGIKKCGAPHFKFGIYRPGNLRKKNLRSVVDFDKIILKKID